MRFILATTCALTLLSGAAFAAEKCSVPTAQWQPREALKTKLEGEGWKVRTVKTEDGCYEVYAFDAKGKKVEAYFNPQTFASVDVKSGD
ncbi:PepSY domain-containing protein [Allorhizobium undicola]|uniref:PepSY domain-containing protein n=1 Tax=Allorhizobium undicola TaxID=78527 RepID=UPI0005682807|nr:PepSY domain-containing protein [Allorhizobium undicola]